MSGNKKQQRNSARAASAAVSSPPAAPTTPWWPWLVAIAVIAVAVFEIYGPALTGPFLLDDQTLPYDRPYPPESLPAWISGVRPLLMFSYWLNYRSSGQETYAYHAVNVILHLLNGGLVWVIVRRLLSRFETDRWRLTALSAFAALLFLLHPLNTESVAYIASRSETLSVFFFYLAFAVFLYARGAVSWPRAIIVLLAFAAACLTKEHTAVFIALALLTDLWWNGAGAVRRNAKLYVPLAAASIAGVVLVWRVISNASSAGFHVKGLSWHDYFFTQCRAIWVYVFMYVLPAGQNIDHDFAITHGVPGAGAIAGLLALIGVVTAACLLRRRFPLACYGVLVFLLLIAPTSSFVPIADPLVERRVYLPFLGLLLVTVDLARRWRTSITILTGTLAAVLVAEGAATYHRNLLWADNLAIWQDAVAGSPLKVRPRFQAAHILYDRNRCADAVQAYAEAAKLATPDDSLLLDWALAEDCAQQPDAAIQKLREALKLSPTAHAYTQLAMLYGRHGQYDEALDALNTAMRIDPNYDMIYFYRGTVFYKQGNAAAAVDEYRRGLALNPRNTVIRDALRQAMQSAPAR